MILRKVAPISSRVFLAPFSLSKELSIGVSFLLCKLILVFILELINMNVLRGVAALLSQWGSSVLPSSHEGW